jgi:hypothetical protein
MIRIFPQLFSYVTIILGLCLWLDTPITVSAAPPPDTNTQVVSLEQIQHIRIETLALTERGVQDSSILQQVVSKRLTQAGFTPVQEINRPHDVIVRVKCEERKTRTGPSQHRKSGHSLLSASRLWKGPACSITYRQQGNTTHWNREVRTSFEEPRQAAKTAGATNVGLYALQELQTQLVHDEFPLYLAAEWGQADRLINLFQQATDNLDRRLLILRLLGPLTSSTVLPTLQKATKTPELALTAITALGHQGEVAIPTLAKILENPGSPEQQLVALQALGVIATHNKAPGLYDQFVQQLQSQDPRIQTVAVRGLGKLGDQRAVTPIETLNLQAWTNPSTHADMQALREALNWSLWQLNPESHTGE